MRSTSTLHLHREPCSEPEAPFLACPTLPSQLALRDSPTVDQNRVAHHAVQSASTLHFHREPCSEQQAPCLACPTLPPQVGLRKPPTVDQIRVPIMLCGRRRSCTSTGSPAQNNRLSFWPALPSPPVGL